MRFMLGFCLFLSSVSWATPASVTILQYHHIGDDTPRVTSVTAAELEAHFAWLKEHQFTVLALSDIQQKLADSEPLPEYTAAITFDDGWANVYREGLSIFKQYRYPFTIFVNPKLMREAAHQYMDWEQLKELQKYGATIANHSNSHWHMTWQRKEESKEQWQQRVRQDILQAQQEIDDALGEQPRLFAYPYGEYNAALEQILADAGFLGFAQHSGAWTKHSSLTAIPRFPASAQYANLTTLGTKLKSLGLPVREMQPSEMLWTKAADKPVKFSVTLANTDDFNPQQMNCFAGGEVIQPTWQGNQFSVSLPQPLPIGRSRVNCTVPSHSQKGRFYWYSQPFIRADENGRWPD